VLRLERVAEGFVVAALAHRDHDGRDAARGLTQDSPLQSGVSLIAEVGLDSPSRRAFLHAALPSAPLHAQAARAVVPGSVSSTAVLRARGLLARTVSNAELGRGWLRAAPMPRPGFRAEPQLIAYLTKLSLGTQHTRGTQHTSARSEERD
jgi:hypothetical protein